MAGKPGNDTDGKTALEQYAHSARPFASVDEVQKERIWRRTKRALEAEAWVPAPKRRRRQAMLLAPWGAAAAGLLLAVGAIGYAFGVHQGTDMGARGAAGDLSGPLPQVNGIPNDLMTGLNLDDALLDNCLPSGLQVVSPDGNWVIDQVPRSQATQLMNLNGMTQPLDSQPAAIVGPYGSDGFLVQVYDGYNRLGVYGVFPDKHRMVPLLKSDGQFMQFQEVVSSGMHWAAICDAYGMNTRTQQWVDVDGRSVDALNEAVDLAWCPGGRWLSVILAGQPGQPFALGLYDLTTGELHVMDPNLTWSGLSRAEHDLLWNPNGTLLAASVNGVLRVYTRSGRRIDTSQAVGHMAWLSPQVLVASAPNQSSLVVEQWLNGRLVQAKGPDVAGTVEQISPIGNHMALVQTTQGVWVISAIGAVEFVDQPVRIAWYNETDQRVYFVARHETEIQQVDVAVNGRSGGPSS